jgi:hypothetical protein
MDIENIDMNQMVGLGEKVLEYSAQVVPNII